MGLAERRVINEFQTNELPKLQEAIDEAAGFQVPMEIHWEQLAPEGESRLYAESWRAIYFQPLIGALKSIGRDQMGRDALHGLKKVVIQNTKGSTRSDDWAAFAAGTLTLDHDPLTNAYASDERSAKLVQILESQL